MSLVLVAPAAMADTDSLNLDGGDEAVLPTASLYGGMGLLDMRNARFMPDGDLALSVAVKEPDDRVALTFQAAPWLEATFRYTIDYALAPYGQRALYDRSFDLKFRLFQEGEYTPQVAIGLQDMIGTGVYSAEYLVASKRFGPIDFTMGMGWGRLASRPAFQNPLVWISQKFATRPGYTDQDVGGTPLFTSYFRGPKVGLFGGIEYETPIPKLTLKVEYSSDAYTQESERQHENYAPFPINVGLSYRFWSNVDVGVSYIGGKEVAANVSIVMDPSEPNFPSRIDPPPPFHSRTDDEVQAVVTSQQIKAGQQGDEPWRVHFVDLTVPAANADNRPPDPAMASANPLLQNAGLQIADHWVEGHTLVMQLAPGQQPSIHLPCAPFVRQASALGGVRDVALLDADWKSLAFCKADTILAQAENVPSGAEQVVPLAPKPEGNDVLSTVRQAVENQRVTVEGIAIVNSTLKIEIYNYHYLRDAEAIAETVRALSAAAPPDITVFEITTSAFQSPLTTVTIPRTEVDALAKHMATPSELWLSALKQDADHGLSLGNGSSLPRFTWSIFPSLEEDLFDPDNPAYIGVGLSGSTEITLLPGWVIDDQATWSIWNDFGDIKRMSNSLLPHVRSDIAEYLKHGASGIDDLTTSYYYKPAPDLYTRATVGYIESMFAGGGGEVLYRPFGERWAVGADLWDVWQRDFNRLFGLQNYHIVTGHVTFYWETPWEGITAKVSAGRYLAGDYGATFELDRRFATGIVIGGWFTLTDVPFHKFGEGSFDKGIRIIIPTEWAVPFATSNKYEFDLRPIQRDGGQKLDNDAILYDMTQSSSYGDLEQQWSNVFH